MPQKNSTRAEAVTHRMREHILQRHFAPGEKLVEVDLTKLYNASRTPVRSALSTLASEGLLIYRPQQGYVVRGFTLKSISEANLVRGRLEAMAAEAAACKPLTKTVDSQFRKILSVGDTILAKGRLERSKESAWQDMNQAFHDLIVAAAGNSFLTEIIGKVWRVPFLSARNVYWYDLEQDYPVVKYAHTLHHQIYKAIARGDPPKAAALMERHIEPVVPHLMRRLVDQRVLGSHEL